MAVMFLAVFLAVACSSSVTETVIPTRESEVVVSEAQSPATQVQTPAPSPTPMSTPTPPKTPTPEPTLRPPQPIPWISSSLMDPSAFVAPSIDQQILESDIIVVASFVSITAAVQTIPGETGVAPTYRPMQVLRFRASEYLKGTGPNEFTVEVLDDSYGIQFGGALYPGYLTREAALAKATELVSQRNTTWDDRVGVLFLEGPLTSAVTASSDSTSGNETRSSTEEDADTSPTPTNFRFVLSNQGVQSSFEYSVDTLSRTWLPATEPPSGGTRSSNGRTSETAQSTSSQYITDGTVTPPPVISLSDLRTRVGEIDTMLRAGSGIEGYSDCFYHTLIRERWFRADPDSKVSAFTFTIESGLAAGTAHLKRESGDPFPDAEINVDPYLDFWNSGPDSQYFKTLIEDEDDVASNGYSYKYTIARPLPLGAYDVNFHIWPHNEALCIARPTDETEDNGYIKYHITVTVPAGTLHEAFFDPITVGTAVKADGADGVLQPTSFTVGGTSTELTSLEWASNQVVLTLGTHVSLSGQVLDFIDLNGNVALSLFADAATANSAAGTYSWPMTSQPWENGDQLMLRIREDATPPTSPTS